MEQSVLPSPSRLDILMLVPHEPGLDPRVHYTANALARHHDVTVMATVRAAETRPSDNVCGPVLYRIERLPYRLWPRIGMLLQLFRLPQARLVSQQQRPPSPPSSGARPLPFWRRIRANIIYALLTGAVNDRLQEALATTPRKPDVIFCHDLYTLQTGIWLKQQTGAKLVYDSHEYYPYQFMHRSFVLPTLWYERRLVRHADLYLTISPELARELEEVFGVAKVEVIPNAEPCPPEPVVPLSPEMERLAAGRLRVLYQGNFVEGRGLEEVLEAWTQVNPARAALFLRGPQNRVQAELKQRTADLGLLDRSVYFLPSVLEKDLIAAAAEADIGLIPYKGDLPSYRFACPNKLSQYMHAGLAILGNNIPFVAGMIRSNTMGWVYDVNEPGSLAAAVTAALDASELAARKANAIDTARTRYCWEVYDARLCDLVESIALRDEAS